MENLALRRRLLIASGIMVAIAIALTWLYTESAQSAYVPESLKLEFVDKASFKTVLNTSIRIFKLI